MTLRPSLLPAAVFGGMLAGAALSFHRMEHLPALLFIAPGYAVQSWLFVRHSALGGLGYQLTIIGVSAAFWTVLVLTLAWVIRSVLRRASRRSVAH